jgi:hypothetical protein
MPAESELKTPKCVVKTQKRTSEGLKPCLLTLQYTGYDNVSFIFQPFRASACWASSCVYGFEIGIPIKPAFSWDCRMHPVCALI